MALAMLLFFIEVIFISSHANNKFSLLVDKDDLFSLSNQAITGWVHTQTAVFPPLFIPAYQLKERKECLVGRGRIFFSFLFFPQPHRRTSLILDVPEYASIGVTLICGQSKRTSCQHQEMASFGGNGTGALIMRAGLLLHLTCFAVSRISWVLRICRHFPQIRTIDFNNGRFHARGAEGQKSRNMEGRKQTMTQRCYPRPLLTHQDRSIVGTIAYHTRLHLKLTCQY